MEAKIERRTVDIITYVAEDGLEFPTAEQCLRHEYESKVRELCGRYDAVEKFECKPKYADFETQWIWHRVTCEKDIEAVLYGTLNKLYDPKADYAQVKFPDWFGVAVNKTTRFGSIIGSQSCMQNDTAMFLDELDAKIYLIESGMLEGAT